MNIHSPEYLDFHEDTISSVLANPEGLGHYYYSKLLGEDFQEQDILYEEEGLWHWRGYLHPIKLLLDHFDKFHGSEAKSKERALVNRLKNLDKHASKNIGHTVLESLIDVWTSPVNT